MLAVGSSAFRLLEIHPDPNLVQPSDRSTIRIAVRDDAEYALVSGRILVKRVVDICRQGNTAQQSCSVEVVLEEQIDGFERSYRGLKVVTARRCDIESIQIAIRGLRRQIADGRTQRRR